MREQLLYIPRKLIALGQKQITFRVNGTPTVDPKFEQKEVDPDPRVYHSMFSEPMDGKKVISDSAQTRKEDDTYFKKFIVGIPKALLPHRSS